MEKEWWFPIIAAIIGFFALIIVFTGYALTAKYFSGENTPANDSQLAQEEGDEIIGEIPPSCSGIVEVAVKYLPEYAGRQISYSQASNLRCGPSNTIGPANVLALDCSGFSTRVYRDAGLFPTGACLNTVGLAGYGKLVKIANTKEAADQVMAPGDILLLGLVNRNGRVEKLKGAHAVVYLGNGMVAESTGPRTRGIRGVQKNKIYRSSGGKARAVLYGVYRAKCCESGACKTK